MLNLIHSFFLSLPPSPGAAIPGTIVGQQVETGGGQYSGNLNQHQRTLPFSGGSLFL
nr:MAG TPA: hypothetical protein [Caudoviricetes sp.]